MNSPATILRLWTKAVKKHEKDKEPEDLPKKGQERKLKIKKGLVKLKLEARNDMAGAKARAAFERVRDRTAKIMQEYCRYLKSSKEEDKKTLPPYLKAVKQLTVVVKKLDPGSLDQGEEEVGLEALEAVDEKEVAGLDEALEQPDEGDETEAEEQDATEAAGDEVPGAGKAVVERLEALTPGYHAAVAAKGPNVSRLQALFSAASGLVKNEDYEQAGKVLDELEPLVRAATGRPAPPPPPGGADAFNARLKALMPRVLEARQANPTIATDLKLGVSEAQVFARKKDFAQANVLLNKVERLLKGEAAAPSGAEVTKRFNALTGGLKAALAAKGPNLARIQTLAGAVSALLNNEDYEQAGKVLDELEPLVRAAGATPAPGPTQSPEAPQGETPDADGELAAEFKRVKAELYAAVPRATAASPAHKDTLIRLLGLAGKHEKAREFGPGLGVLEDLREAIAKALATAPAEGGKEVPPKADGAAAALAGWQAARQKAIGQLRQLGGAIAGTGDPEARQPLILVNAIIKNLTPSPSTPQSVAELERYLQTDNVITDAEIPNSWGVTVELRKPLLQALAPLKKVLGS